MGESAKKPTVLIILDGWGVAPEGEGNAIRKARTPVMDRLIRNYPTFTLRAAGDEVGLAWGEMGNSQVGHLTIGAGRVVYQTLPRINKSIQDGSFFENEAFLQACATVKKNGSTLHLVGMASSSGVHSHSQHLYALLELAHRAKIKDVAIHMILDGRDAAYNSAPIFIKELEDQIQEIGVGRIASMAGRYWTMDRDNRWDRTQKGFEVFALAKGERVEDPLGALEVSYAAQVYDEEFKPVVVGDGAPVKPTDAIILFNFREDRMRQITKVLALPTFEKFDRGLYVVPEMIATMTQYEKDLPVTVAFPPQAPETCLAREISETGIAQLHIAETEKYAHITFFLNAYREEPYPGEERIIIPSPQVTSYEEAPEMSAKLIGKTVLETILKGKAECIMVNFSNADMVGHTGNMKATIRAIEVIDAQIGLIVAGALAHGGSVVITADHGNAEELLNLQTKILDKEHSTNPVPCIIVKKEFEAKNAEIEAVGGDLSLLQPRGTLSDIAPTILKIMGRPIPESMTGAPLI